jgi:hypothetical protein
MIQQQFHQPVDGTCCKECNLIPPIPYRTSAILENILCSEEAQWFFSGKPDRSQLRGLGRVESEQQWSGGKA